MNNASELKDLVVDEAPQRDQLVQCPGVVVVPKDAGQSHHDDTSIVTG